MAGDVILGYDGSDGAKAALPHAVEIAKAFGATVVVTFGYEPNPQGGEVAHLARQIEHLGEQITAEGVAAVRALDPTVPVEAAIVADRPVESLIDAAVQRHARMIVIGGNGRGPLVGTALGSVGYRLIPEAPVPVLIVQPTEG